MKSGMIQYNYLAMQGAEAQKENESKTHPLKEPVGSNHLFHGFKIKLFELAAVIASELHRSS